MEHRYLSGMESGENILEDHDRVARICDECLSLFQMILKHHSKDPLSSSNEHKMAHVSLQRSYGRLKMWSDKHGASSGGIDKILTTSSALKIDALEYLTSIGQTLANSKLSCSYNAMNAF